jgi:hypothetical protein
MCERAIPLRPLPPGLQAELEQLLGTEFSPGQAAEHLSAVIEHVLFHGEEGLDVPTLEALRFPWHLMRALQTHAHPPPAKRTA